MTTRTIAALCQRSHELSRTKGWYDGEEKDPRPISLVTLLAQSELIEALEEWRANRKLDEIYFSGPDGIEVPYGSLKEEAPIEKYKPEGILVEIGDAVIRIAQRMGSDEADMQSLIDGLAAACSAHSITWSSDFETMLATCMADLSMAYLVTTPGGLALALASGMPNVPKHYFASTWMGIFKFCEQNKLDLWGAIELKEKYNATRPYKHNNKRC
jgi:hypothetical protein